MTHVPLLNRHFMLAAIANLLMGLSFTMFLHFPGFLADLGANEVTIGFIVGVAAITAIAARPAIGVAMDRVGRRPVILIGHVLNTAAVALYLTVTEISAWLYVVRAIHGVAVAILFTSLFTYAADVVPAARRTEGLALFGVSGLLPIALGGVIGDLVLSAADFRALFLTALAFALAAGAASVPLEELFIRDESELPQRFHRAVAQRALLPIWWMAGMFSVVLTGYFTFLKTYVAEVGFGSVGSFFAAYAGVAILERLFFAWLPDRAGRERVLYVSLAAIVTGFVVLAFATNDVFVIAAGVLCGAGHGYAFPILYGYTVERARRADLGSAVAFFTALFDIGTIVGGVALGAVITFAGYRAMYLTAAAAMAIAVALYARWNRGVSVPATSA